MTGLYNKFTVTKTDGSPTNPDARYFVLDLNDRVARRAVMLFAKMSRNMELHRDLRDLDEAILNRDSFVNKEDAAGGAKENK